MTGFVTLQATPGTLSAANGYFVAGMASRRGAKGRAVLPIARRGSSAEAIEGDLGAQLQGSPTSPVCARASEGTGPA